MDSVNIMNIGNELYSGLSRLSRQTFLLLTELPEVLNVFNTDYQLQYSSSYSGTVNGRAIIHDLSFCMPLVDALLTLVRQNYQSFLLTIECSTVYWVVYGKPSRNLCLISWVFSVSVKVLPVTPLVSGVFVHRAFCAYFLRIERVVELRRFLWWTQ